MSKREDLKTWVKDSLRRQGGEAKLIDVAKDIWTHQEPELRASGDLFFTWQCEMRWACTARRKDGAVQKPTKRGAWRLVAGH